MQNKTSNGLQLLASPSYYLPNFHFKRNIFHKFNDDRFLAFWPTRITLYRISAWSSLPSWQIPLMILEHYFPCFDSKLVQRYQFSFISRTSEIVNFVPLRPSSAIESIYDCNLLRPKWIPSIPKLQFIFDFLSFNVSFYQAKLNIPSSGRFINLAHQSIETFSRTHDKNSKHIRS